MKSDQEKLKYFSDVEVEKMDDVLFEEIEEYINEKIVNWEETCECEEEGDYLDFFLTFKLPSWRLRNDGTIDVIMEGESRESFEFKWENMEGEEVTSNALALLRGNVSHAFDDGCNNALPNGLNERSLKLFN